MNSKGHMICSLIKSVSRIAGCIAMIFWNFPLFAILFLFAELLGILEEVLDFR